MITPGSTGDWVMGAGMFGALATFAVAGHRWVLMEIHRVDAT